MGLFSVNIDAGEKEAKKLVYTPPDRGAPVARVSGGTRSTDNTALIVRVLAPAQIAYTLETTPVFYWFVSERIVHPVTITIVDNDQIDPILEKRLEPPFAKGIHAIRLSDHGISLEPGRTYHWGISVEVRSGDRFKDLYAGADIKRIAVTNELQKELAAISDVDAAIRLLAARGIWYDALAKLSERLESSNRGSFHRDQLSQLLAQAALPIVSSHAASGG